MEHDKQLVRSQELIHRSVSLINYENRQVFYADMKNNSHIDTVYIASTIPKFLWSKGYVQYYVRPKNQKGLNVAIVSTPQPVAYVIDMTNMKYGTELSVNIDNVITLSGRASVLNLFQLDAVLLNYPF